MKELTKLETKTMIKNDLETTKYRADREQILHRKSIAYLLANVEMAEIATTKGVQRDGESKGLRTGKPKGDKHGTIAKILQQKTKMG